MGNLSSITSSASSTEDAVTLENISLFEKFIELPDNLDAQVFSTLPLQDKSGLARTSHYYYGLFSQHIHAAKCLMFVAHGDQTAADMMLRRNPKLLLECADVTDYSGRKFEKITAYEYAYWAKDTHMCRMLEAHMDKATKAKMLLRIDAMEMQGLTYEQHGVVVEHSTHFDFTPLIKALTNYVALNNFDIRSKKAWMYVGVAQRDLPVHVMNEYFHPNRSFHPIPAFNEEILPRNLTFYNEISDTTHEVFPLVVSSSGLGVDFALTRGSGRSVSFGGWGGESCDLEALINLDEVRTADLALSRENLKPSGPGHSLPGTILKIT